MNSPRKLFSHNERTVRIWNLRRSRVSTLVGHPGLKLLTGGGCLEKSTYRVLVVDDYEPWRSFAIRTLHNKSELRVVGEASDGLEAVQKAQELHPDLVLLDIGLPSLDGIAVARRILQHAPKIKIIFMSEQKSCDIVEAALGAGARGYVVKSRAATELWPAVEAVLQGKQFVSAKFTDSMFRDPENECTAHDRSSDKVARAPLFHVDTAHHHEVGFYSDDRRLLDDVAQFIGAALKAGNAAIVVATESHRNGLLPRLRAQGAEIGAAIEQGRYIPLDAADTLSALMLNSMPDPVRFLKLLGDLIVTASKPASGESARVAIFGECVHLLWAKGNAEAAIQFEKLGNQLAKKYDVDILCGYSVGAVQKGMDEQVFQQICAEHSAVHARELR